MADDVFDESEMAKFQAVCPNCSEVFEIDEEVLVRVNGEIDSFVGLTCPQCDWRKLYEV